MTGQSYVTDISLAGIPARAPSMLLGTIRVGHNTYMGVSRACDDAMAAPSSVPRAFLDPFLRGVTFLATKGLDEILSNKANQHCHFKTYTCRALDLVLSWLSTRIVMAPVCFDANFVADYALVAPTITRSQFDATKFAHARLVRLDALSRGHYVILRDPTLLYVRGIPMMTIDGGRE